MAKTEGRFGWLTAVVASSIAWPQDDVLVEYDGVDFLLHGARQEDGHRFAPCISTPSTREETSHSLSRLYRFTSILGFFMRGYVDITSSNWGTRIIRYAAQRDNLATMLQNGTRRFSCNHMPIIEDDQVRKALAFFREGRRLEHVHEPYSFLSYFKVLESQFRARDRVEWVGKNLDLVTEERAVARINLLRAQGVDVNNHLFESGRCAVAHASVDGNIVDPDVPADRQRIAADLHVIAALAKQYIKIDAEVPDEMDLFNTRDRLVPWYTLMASEAVQTMRAGGALNDASEIENLVRSTVTVCLWPDTPPEQFRAMTFLPREAGAGGITFFLRNERGTIYLAFLMDVQNGRMHALLEDGGLRADSDITEQDVEDHARYFHSVIGNRIVELSIEGVEPVDCDVIIPVNIIPRVPEEAIAEALERFRAGKQLTPA
ncbi:MAG: hypothetical protein Q7R66_13385 [Undibacterium sp.]|uniref:methylamine utilization protein MauJ n=1 Tax=Undibacterium sp. TaxID=1914977 RepID=UPI0027161C2F|nr:methylamine utilization protein MauJ [Undibacterium sp.]MDO8653172.1 hypothetical protein [Undibacterium sp.]